MADCLRKRVTRFFLLAGLVFPVLAESSLEPPRQESVQRTNVEQLCVEIGNKLGSVSVEDCLRQGLRDSGSYSVLGRPIGIKEYPPSKQKKPLGRVLVVGGTHGDEYSSVSVVFKWMDLLNKHHSGLFHWHFVPLHNPDGLLRKKSQRQNERGVDLNRNFPTADWESSALAYWEKRTRRNVRRYPGPVASSEPETRFLVEEIASFKPDVIVSLHAPYGLVDHDGPPKAPHKLGYLRLERLGVFPGSLGNYGGVDLDVPVVTVELAHAGIMPSRAEISLMWVDLVRWLVREQRRKVATR